LTPFKRGRQNKPSSVATTEDTEMISLKPRVYWNTEKCFFSVSPFLQCFSGCSGHFSRFWRYRQDSSSLPSRPSSKNFEDFKRTIFIPTYVVGRAGLFYLAPRRDYLVSPAPFTLCFCLAKQDKNSGALVSVALPPKIFTGPPRFMAEILPSSFMTEMGVTHYAILRSPDFP